MNGHSHPILSFTYITADKRALAQPILDGYLKGARPTRTRTVIHMVGIPGSRKTTFSRELQRQLRAKGFHYVRLDHDDVMEALAAYQADKEKDPVAAFNKWQKPARAIGNSIMSVLANRRVNLILDHGATSENRQKLLGEFKRRGYRTIMYYMPCPVGVALERVKAREELTGRHTPPRLIHERARNLGRWLRGYKRTAGRFVTVNTALKVAQPH